MDGRLIRSGEYEEKRRSRKVKDEIHKGPSHTASKRQRRELGGTYFTHSGYGGQRGTAI